MAALDVDSSQGDFLQQDGSRGDQVFFFIPFSHALLPGLLLVHGAL